MTTVMRDLDLITPSPPPVQVKVYDNWSHVVTGPDLYFCPACRKVSNVPVFCACYPDRVRVLSVCMAIKP